MRGVQVVGPRIVRFGRGFRAVGVAVASPTFRSNEEGLGWLTEYTASLSKSRAVRECACLCCGVIFLSEGFHNRMCKQCRGRGDALGEPQRPVIQR